MGVALKRRPARARTRRSVPIPVCSEVSRVRRGFDIAIASSLFVVLSPLLLLAIVAVACTGRPIFFGHRRLGLDGVPFLCWKLRTMTPDAEELLDREPDLRERYRRNGFKLPVSEDPRITLVGGVLRRTYIDEIPQLYNVLCGEMSVIGPRPIVEAELRNYGKRGPELLRVKPGLLGAWTSLGRSRPSYPQRAYLELDYVNRRSVLRDLRILVRSVPVVLRGQSDRM
ncbi:MAG: sugar transferase [Gemmatimonadota bacterium]